VFFRAKPFYDDYTGRRDAGLRNIIEQEREGFKMSKHTAMFRKAAGAAGVAEAGIRAMEKGKILLYQGGFTKLAGIGTRIAPRSLTRKLARKMNH
jgi:hypothetical protein